MCAGVDGTQFAGMQEEPASPLDQLSVRPGTESLTPVVVGRALEVEYNRVKNDDIESLHSIASMPNDENRAKLFTLERQILVIIDMGLCFTCVRTCRWRPRHRQ